MGTRAVFIALMAALGVAAPAAGLEAAPPRVFSADYCADQYALALADKASIVALSPDAERDFSYLRHAAMGVTRARPDAERILAARPDIVLTAWGADARRLEKLDLEVAALPYANGLDDIETVIAAAAEALGRKAAGARMIDNFRTRRAELAQRARARGRSPRALYATPGGVSAGAGTLVDALMTLAGLENAAGARAGWPDLPAERLIAAPPDLIVAGFFKTDGARADNWSLSRHPALEKLFAQTPTVHLPADVLACPAWFVLDAAEAMADAADQWADKQKTSLTGAAGR